VFDFLEFFLAMKGPIALDQLLIDVVPVDPFSDVKRPELLGEVFLELEKRIVIRICPSSADIDRMKSPFFGPLGDLCIKKVSGWNFEEIEMPAHQVQVYKPGAGEKNNRRISHLVFDDSGELNFSL
jgi:hypothetical protein